MNNPEHVADFEDSLMRLLAEDLGDAIFAHILAKSRYMLDMKTAGSCYVDANGAPLPHESEEHAFNTVNQAFEQAMLNVDISRLSEHSGPSASGRY